MQFNKYGQSPLCLYPPNSLHRTRVIQSFAEGEDIPLHLDSSWNGSIHRSSFPFPGTGMQRIGGELVPLNPSQVPGIAWMVGESCHGLIHPRSCHPSVQVGEGGNSHFTKMGWMTSHRLGISQGCKQSQGSPAEVRRQGHALCSLQAAAGCLIVWFVLWNQSGSPAQVLGLCASSSTGAREQWTLRCWGTHPRLFNIPHIQIKARYKPATKMFYV